MPRSAFACFGLSVLAVLSLTATQARADEAGQSFWLPGTYGSLAAIPPDPGWSLTLLNNFASATASGSEATARQIRIGRFDRTLDVNTDTRLYTSSDVEYFTPGYAFATPVLGGRLQLTLGTLLGVGNESLDSSRGNSLGRPGAMGDTLLSEGGVGIGDLAPQATIFWSEGSHNWMTYVTGGIPVGTYNAADLVTFGLGHGALDAGAGYTYLNAQTGHEFSAVTGFTYNFINPSTNYQNGVDWHLDWGASQYVNDHIHMGVVGYLYQQLSGDQNCDPTICPHISRVLGVGPQVGFNIPGDLADIYINLRGYGEFDAASRPAGWNAWITITFTFHSDSPQGGS